MNFTIFLGGGVRGKRGVLKNNPILGLISIYSDLADAWVIDESDREKFHARLQNTGRPYYTSILMDTLEQKRQLAEFCLKIPRRP